MKHVKVDDEITSPIKSDVNVLDNSDVVLCVDEQNNEDVDNVIEDVKPVHQKGDEKLTEFVVNEEEVLAEVSDKIEEEVSAEEVKQVSEYNSITV